MTKTIDRNTFLILSVERTREECACVWWRTDAMGYTTSLAEAGLYSPEEIRQHADPPHHVAIPITALEVPASALRGLLKLASDISRFARHPA